ncbi:MAG: hypothetical protein BMS9Abin29_1444 [Gemmatimonadota bacterium]|nr:MAG: hypothetical protein BMS9Abin29_1444 [Gemmatimonadota bacterium]
MTPDHAADVRTSIPVPVHDPKNLRIAVFVYLAILPLGHLVTFWVWGARATLADPALLIVLAVALFELVRLGPGALRHPSPLPPPRMTVVFHAAALLLVGFGVWAASTALWGVNPEYAQAKGAGYLALALGAVAILWCGADWRNAVDAWLLGTLLSLIVLWVPALVGLDALSGRVIQMGYVVGGLPIPRVQGPFFHPNMFGDYLVVSGALLWARWDDLRYDWTWLPLAGAALLAVTLVLTASTAWIGAGVLLAMLGLAQIRGGRRAGSRIPALPVALIAGGVLLLVMTLIVVLLPVNIVLGDTLLVVGGFRPRIWGSVLQVIEGSPLAGVGASPWLAAAVDPMGVEGRLAYWDAHNIYLSVLGQFGVAGLALLASAIVLLVREMLRQGATRARIAFIAALLAVSAHGVAIASEDFRHLWALLGLVGLAGLPRVPEIAVRAGREREETVV